MYLASRLDPARCQVAKHAECKRNRKINCDGPQTSASLLKLHEC